MNFATSQRPPPGLEAVQPLPTSGCQLFWCQESLRPSTEPVQQPFARRLLVARFSPLNSEAVAVPQQRTHPVVQQPDPDQLRRYSAMLRELNAGRRYGVLAVCQMSTLMAVQCPMAWSTFGRNIRAVIHWRVSKLCLWDGSDAQSRSLRSKLS